MTQRVWGYVNQDDATIAAYFVEWTPGHVQNPANFDLIRVRRNRGRLPSSRCIESAQTHRARVCSLLTRASDTTLRLIGT